MQRWHPNMSKLPCDGESCPNYRTDEDGTIKLEIDGVNITTVLSEDFSIGNMTSSRNFLFTPDVASVEIAAESDVLEALETTTP